MKDTYYVGEEERQDARCGGTSAPPVLAAVYRSVAAAARRAAAVRLRGAGVSELE